MTNEPPPDPPRMRRVVEEIEGLVTSRCLATPHLKSIWLDVQLTRGT